MLVWTVIECGNCDAVPAYSEGVSLDDMKGVGIMGAVQHRSEFSVCSNDSVDLRTLDALPLTVSFAIGVVSLARLWACTIAFSCVAEAAEV